MVDSDSGSLDPERPPVIEGTDGSVFYRASSLGSCEVALIALRMGMEAMPPPKSMLPRFADGHLHEASILQRVADLENLRYYRLQPERDQDQLCWEVGEVKRAAGAYSVFVQGSIDGLAEHPAHGPIVVDAKALSQSSWESWVSGQFKAWPHYAWQLSAYAYALGDLAVGEVAGKPLPILMAVKNKNTGEVRGWVYPEPPITRSQILAKLLKVEMRAASGLLPFCADQQWMCPTWYLHADSDSDAGITTDWTEQQMGEAEALGIQYEKAKVEEHLAKARKDRLRDQIIHLVGDSGKVRTAGGWSVKTWQQAAPKSLNRARLVEDHPEINLDEYYEPGPKGPRVKVTGPGSDDA